MTRAKLIAALEGAQKGSRELDALVHEAVWGEPIAWEIEDLHKHYTTSLDAALTLVPEGWNWRVQGDGLAALCAPDANMGDYFAAATPALALCIAALKAGEQS